MIRQLFFNLITTLLLITLYQSCISTESSQDVIRYGNSYDFESTKKVILESNRFKTFDQLRNRSQEISCSDSIPVLRFTSANAVTKEIYLFAPCWEQVVCILIKRRNVLKIVDDEIHKHIVYPIDSITHLTKRHYTNNKKLEHFSEHSSKALISVDYKFKSFDNLPILLDQITLAFESLDLDSPLIVQLAQVIPPPPPPIL